MERVNYAFLDYDGFICKAWYAHISDNGKTDPLIILKELEQDAITKAREAINGKLHILKFLSGHSWKKDLYNTYKANRTKDPFIGAMRDWVKQNDDTVITPKTLEADEVIAMLVTYIKRCDRERQVVNNSLKTIIFSDDKDLHRISEYYCGVNTTSEIEKNYNDNLYYEQFLAGDKEDNVTGIRGVGYKKAEKLLSKNGYSLEGVIRSYKECKATKEECIKNLVLIDPMRIEHNTEKNLMNDMCYFFLEDYMSEIFDDTEFIQNGLVQYMTEEVNKIYD